MAIRVKENQLDHKDQYGIPTLWTILDIERGLASVPTVQAFAEFQEHMVLSSLYVPKLTNNSNYDAIIVKSVLFSILCSNSYMSYPLNILCKYCMLRTSILQLI